MKSTEGIEAGSEGLGDVEGGVVVAVEAVPAHALAPRSCAGDDEEAEEDITTSCRTVVGRRKQNKKGGSRAKTKKDGERRCVCVCVCLDTGVTQISRSLP